jgi:hypothetical protein
MEFSFFFTCNQPLTEKIFRLFVGIAGGLNEVVLRDPHAFGIDDPKHGIFQVSDDLPFTEALREGRPDVKNLVGFLLPFRS